MYEFYRMPIMRYNLLEEKKLASNSLICLFQFREARALGDLGYTIKS